MYGHMNVKADDHVFKTLRASAFNDTTLGSLLKGNDIESPVIAGQVTGGCEESTIRPAPDVDYYTVLAKYATGSVSKERHDKLMSGWLAHTYCPDTADIIDHWESGTKTGAPLMPGKSIESSPLNSVDCSYLTQYYGLQITDKPLLKRT